MSPSLYSPVVLAMSWLLVAVVAPSSAAHGRTLRGYDAWVATASCPWPPTASNSQKDGMGRFWGYAGGSSCAFKDEQQQPLSPNQVTPLQTWSQASPCPEAPAASNSSPDSLGRLWGIWWGKSCAFKTSTGQPAYYSGYTGPRIGSAPSPSPQVVIRIPSPSPTPVILPRQSPSPSPTVPVPSPPTKPIPSTPSVPSPSPKPSSTAASPAPTKSLPAPPVGPSPAPTKSSPASPEGCTCPDAVNVKVDANAVATIIASQLWQKLADASNSYEGSLVSVAEGPTNNTAQAQPQISQVTALLAAMEFLASQQPAASPAVASKPTNLTDDTATAAVRPSDDPHAMDDGNTTAPIRPSDNPHVMDYLDTSIAVPSSALPGNTMPSNTVQSNETLPLSQVMLAANNSTIVGVEKAERIA